MKALYICDNKEYWSEIRNLFNAHFPKIELTYTTRGGEAFELLTIDGPFSLIIIDVAMKDEEPAELFEQAIDIAGVRPVLFIGEVALINSRVPESIHEDEESPYDTIIRPLSVDIFLNRIEAALGWLKKEDFEQSIDEIDPKELLPMRLRNFYLFKEVPYDVYLELTNTKFLKVISKNEPYTHAQLISYSKRHLKQLYLKKDVYLQFLEDGIKEVSKVLFVKNLKFKVAIPYQIKACLIIHQYIKTVGVTADISRLIKRVIDVTGEVFNNHPDYRQIIHQIPFYQGDFAEQSVLTSYVAETMLQGMGWRSDTSRKKLGLAAILQDAFLTNEDMLKISTLDDPNLKMFTPEEQEEYRDHPKKAAEIAANIQGISEADFILEQHHELPSGNGFPAGLTMNKLTAHSCTFILASNYVTRLSLTRKELKDKIRIVEELRNIYKQGNFKEPLNVLEKAIKG